MDIIMVKYDVQNSDEQTELALITPSNGTKPYYDLENEISVLTHNKVANHFFYSKNNSARPTVLLYLCAIRLGC